MKNAKIWIAVLALICFAAGFGASMCWKQQQHHQRPNMLDAITEEANLTVEQRAKAEKFITEMKDKIKVIRAPIAEQMHAAEKKLYDDLWQILTPEQRQKLEERAKRQQERMNKRYPLPSPTPAPIK